MTHGTAWHSAQDPRSLSKCVYPLLCMCVCGDKGPSCSHFQGSTGPLLFANPLALGTGLVHPLVTLHLCEPH